MVRPSRGTSYLGRLGIVAGLAVVGSAGTVGSQGLPSAFVHFESPHVHPLDLSPDRTLLAAVNTADNRLLLFDVTGAQPLEVAAIPVGLDPISVRFRSDDEAWVVNHQSDSVSVVDVPTRRLRATLATDDEPADVVFAGRPQRAFVSASQANTVLVFNPEKLSRGPRKVTIEGEDPRSLAVSPDGATVYVGVFESGNRSTILSGGIALRHARFLPTQPDNVVTDPAGPYGGANPPPNAGSGFSPPLGSNLPPPPPVSLIVKRNVAGRWLDDNGANWVDFVSGGQAFKTNRVAGWDVIDNDIAVIDAASLSVSYVEGLMNIVMALGVNPATGAVTAVGTDATNEIRFEPVLAGRFLRVNLAVVSARGAPRVSDLNPHLDYRTPSVPPWQRGLSVGDPRAIVWSSSGRGWVAGLGSNNVVEIDSRGARVGAPIEVGEGPTGLVLDETRERLWVLSRFAASVSAIDTARSRVAAKVNYFDPTPAAIREGRPHLFDTMAGSGTGHIACASCHVDARTDRLAWDLGNPAGAMKSDDDQNKTLVPGDTFADWHPMKGPMTTQSLVDIIGKEPHHWRGDRDGIEEFAPAFRDLQGTDKARSKRAMRQLENYLAMLYFPPNPYRRMDNSLPDRMDLEGHYRTERFGAGGQPLPPASPRRGLALFRERIQLNGRRCVDCHTLPTGFGTNMARVGTGYVPIPPGPNGEQHLALIGNDLPEPLGWKIPQLRGLYDKVGMEATRPRSRSGFGFGPDGITDSLARFVGNEGFSLRNDQEVADMVAFLLAFSGNGLTSNPDEPPGLTGNDVPAGVGSQVTIGNAGGRAAVRAMVRVASVGDTELVAKGLIAGEQRGWLYEPDSGTFRPDSADDDNVSLEKLLRLASRGSELTFTLVPLGSGQRVGVDRDLDGVLDFDERSAGARELTRTVGPGGDQGITDTLRRAS